MQNYEITLSKAGVEIVSSADCYQQEGPMTTFFQYGDGRSRVDPWSRRVASFKTTDISAIRSVAGSDSESSSLLEIVA